jgi:phospholipid/cholesterol/gamma-HCH transport system permease protein
MVCYAKSYFKEIDDLIIDSLGIVAFISLGGVVAIQTALNLTNPLIPKYLIDLLQGNQ